MANTAPFNAWERMIAARYLRTKRENGGITIISILSFFGVMLAVMVLIIVMSVMNGFRTELLNKVLGVNGHAYIDTRGLSPEQTSQVIIKTKALPDVVSAIPLIQGQVLVSTQNGATGAVVQGITKTDFDKMKLVQESIKTGSYKDWGIGEFGGDEIAIGAILASNLGVFAGDYIEVLTPNGSNTIFGSTPISKEYKVGAIFEVGMSTYDQTLIYMPLEQAQLFFGKENIIDTIEIRLKNPEKTAEFALEASGFVNQFLISDWKQQSASFVSALGVERAVMRLILMMLILIAALNIISGLVMLVKNKGKDIAVLRTMGASKNSIMRIFLMIGASIGVLGTLCGVILGTLFCLNIGTIQKLIESVFGSVFPAEVYFLSQIPAHVEWIEVFYTAGFSLLMSVLVTIPPAWRAAKLDPVEALRYE